MPLFLATILFSLQVLPAEQLRPRYRPDRLIIIPRAAGSGPALARMHARQGRRLMKSFQALGGIQVLQLAPGEDVAQAVAAYQASGLVALAEPDFKLHAAVTPNDPDFTRGNQWSLQNTLLPGNDIHAAGAWDTLHSASNIVVAVVDSGIRYTHEDLAANIWVNAREIPGNGIDDDGNGVVDDVYGFNAVNDSGDPMDDDGHGTHVAGIIGAVGNNGRGIAGVAWNVQIMACKFLDAQGSGDTSDAIQCIDYARRMGAQIINASWGGADYSSALYNAISAARTAGIIVVAAAGNDAENIDRIPLYPACYNLDNIVVVGATSRTDSFESSYSSYGAVNVDLCAPGSGIFSTWFTWDGAYTSLSGTSMATPHVSGALALMKARFTNLTSSQLIARLLGSVDVLPGLAGKCRTSGRLNLENALGTDPVANFAASKLTGEPPLSVTFTNLSLGSLASAQWNFGDGSAPASGDQPAHVFAKDGDYPVRLEVTGTNGRTNRFVQTVSVRSNYEFISEPYQWIDPTGMTALSLGDNSVSPSLDLGFEFPFYGQNYTWLFVGANGLVGFGSDGLSDDNTSIANTATPNGVICPYWDNLNPAAGGSVYAGTTGEAPNRKFVVSWVDVPRNSSAVPLTFQVILEEATGEMVFQYLDVRPQTSRGGAKRATVGVENETGTTGSLYTYNGSPHILENNSALRVRQRPYDFLFSTNGPVHLRVVKGWPLSTASAGLVSFENAGTKSLSWRIEGAPVWLSLGSQAGTLTGKESTSIEVQAAESTAQMPAGEYTGELRLTNTLDGAGGGTVQVILSVEEPAAILKASIDGGNSFSGGLGGPFAPSSVSVNLENTGNIPLDWSAAADAGWITFSQNEGTIEPGQSVNVRLRLTTEAEGLGSGPHDATVVFDNVTSGSAPVELPVRLDISARIQQASAAIVNGRFQGQLNFAADAAYVIEFSTDLVNWFPLDTSGSANGGLILFDDALDGAARFYRVRGL